MDLDKTMEALKKNRYEVTLCETAAEAADYLAQTITGKKIGFGDSATLNSSLSFAYFTYCLSYHIFL